MDNIKSLHLILDSLAKSKTLPIANQKIYLYMQDILEQEALSIKTNFTCNKIDKLLSIDTSSVQSVDFYLEKFLSPLRPESLAKQKDDIFNSLLSGNFPLHVKELEKGEKEFESSLTQVESKMYMMIKEYIKAICLSLEFYMIFDELKQRSIQEVTTYGMKMHECVVKNLFFEEEKEQIDDSLKQILVIYIGIYYQNFYMQSEAV